MTTSPTAALVERAADLAALQGALDQALAREGACALVEGPAGIGKTSLLAAAVAAAEDQGFRVLAARAGELEVELPYGVVRQLLERWALSPAEPDRAPRFDGAAGLAAPVFGLQRAGAGLVGADPLSAALHGLYWLMVGLAEHGPLLLVVDDVQWADPPSTRWLAYVARRLAGLPVAVLLAGRPRERDGEALASLTRDAAVLRPAPLSRDGVERIVRDRLGDDDRELCAACHEVTAGNPFLLRELLATVAPGDLAAADVQRLGPASVGAGILGRVRRIGPGAEALTQAVAVLGADATLRHAARLAGIGDEDAGRALDDLVLADVLDGGRPLRFVHPIVRTAVAHAIAPGRAQRLHQRAAQLLADAGADPDVVAGHLLAVDPGADPHVVRTLRAAAAQATTRGAPGAAAVYLRRAVEEPPRGSDRADTLHELGLALLADREPSAFRHLREAIDLMDDSGARGERSLELVRALGMAGMNEDAVASAARALDAGPHAPAVAGRLACELVADAFAVPSALPRALARLRAIEREGVPPDVEPLVAITEAAYAIFSAQADDVAGDVLLRTLPAVVAGDRSRVVVITLFALVWSDRIESARAMGAHGIALARAAGSQHVEATFAMITAWAALRAGDLHEALALAEPGHEFRRARRELGDASLIWSLALMLELLTERGELEAAERAWVDAGIGAELRDFLPANRLLEARGRLRTAQGRWREGLADLLDVGRRWEDAGVRNPTLTAWRSSAALALLQTGRRERALELADEELEDARAFGRPYPLGIALRVAAVVRRDEALLLEAVEVLRDSPVRLEHAKALCELGALRRRMGRRAESRDPLLQALDLAGRCGAGPVVERVRSELAAIGARPRRDRLAGRDALTPAELRVAGLAADGRSNRDIAQALFLTLRTVETHLTSTYRKLDITSRRQLGEALADR